MPRTNVTTYSIIIAYNVFTLVGGFALDWPMGNVLLLAWAETVMFVVGGTAANARLRWQSRHGGRKICDDFAVATVDNAALNSALEHPASFFFRDLIFCLGHGSGRLDRGMDRCQLLRYGFLGPIGVGGFSASHRRVHRFVG